MTLPGELATYLERHPETRFVDAVLYDLCGTAIGKRVPVRDRPSSGQAASPSAPESRRWMPWAPAGM